MQGKSALEVPSYTAVIVTAQGIMVQDTANAIRLLNQQPRRKRRGCCSHKVVAVGFNTLCYDASVGVLNPPHESKIADYIPVW